MRFHNHRPIPYFTFSGLDSHPGLRHAVLTRLGGVSPAPWASLNLGWTVGDSREHVETNYRLWAAAFGLRRQDLTTTWQVHGNRVLVADADHRGGSLGQADALITATPFVPLVQRYADCTPILLYDPVRHACGIAHAGWRGTAARCAEATVRAMVEAFGSHPVDLIAGIGPAIGPCCYEVGADVIAAIRAGHRQTDGLLLPTAHPDKAYLDLWQANAEQLREAGVRHIEIAGLCTACRRDLFFSHRGDGGRSGRFGAFIMLTDR